MAETASAPRRKEVNTRRSKSTIRSEYILTRPDRAFAFLTTTNLVIVLHVCMLHSHSDLPEPERWTLNGISSFVAVAKTTASQLCVRVCVFVCVCCLSTKLPGKEHFEESTS